MSLTINPQLISNLNSLHGVPLAISRFLVDQVTESIANGQDVNEDLLIRIIQTQLDSEHQLHLPTIVRALAYFIKFTLKQEFPVKAIGQFLSEKTLLPAQLSQYICQKYQGISLGKGQIKKAKLQQINWSACNLKQSRQGQAINKMYMKLYVRTLDNGNEVEKVINCQLPQFKLILTEMMQIGANMK